MKLFGVITLEAGEDADAVEKSMGAFGPWHLWALIALLFIKVPTSAHLLSIVFLAPPTTFSCIDNALAQCDEACPSHVFNKTVFSDTIITEWDLVCEKRHLSDFAQTITMLGVLCGGMFMGIISDKFGRRKPILVALLVSGIAGTAQGLSTTFLWFLILRFFCSAAVGGSMLTAFVLLVEISGKRIRTPMSVIFHLPYNIGHALLPLIAYYIRSWRYLQIALSLPSFVMLPFVYWCLPESPRWYLAVGKTDQAVATIEEAAIQNDLPISHIKDDIAKLSKEMESDSKQNANILDLFKTPNMLKKTVFISYNWFVCGMCYFGMALFVSRMSGDIFVNVAMSALTTVPSAFITMCSMNYLGRRNTLIGSNIIASLALLAVPFVPESLTWLQTSLSSLGILALMVAFYDVYTYGGELYPTVVRNVGIGTSSMCARIGAMIAPFIASLGEVNPIIPLIAFGTPPIIGSVMCCFLPETKNCKLPDTVEEGELFGKLATTKNRNTSSEPN